MSSYVKVILEADHESDHERVFLTREDSAFPTKKNVLDRDVTNGQK